MSYFEIWNDDAWFLFWDKLMEVIPHHKNTRFSIKNRKYSCETPCQYVVYMDKKRYWASFEEYEASMKQITGDADWWDQANTLDMVPDYAIRFIGDAFYARFLCDREIVSSVGAYVTYRKHHDMVTSESNNNHTIKAALWVIFKKLGVKDIPHYVEMANLTLTAPDWWNFIETVDPGIKASAQKKVYEAIKMLMTQPSLIKEFSRIQQIIMDTHISTRPISIRDVDISFITVKAASMKLLKQGNFAEYYKIHRHSDDEYVVMNILEDVPLHQIEKTITALLSKFSYCFEPAIARKISCSRFEKSSFIIAPRNWFDYVQSWIMPILACTANFQRRNPLPLASYAMDMYIEGDYFFVAHFIHNLIDPCAVFNPLTPDDMEYTIYGKLHLILEKFQVHYELVRVFNDTYMTGDKKYTGLKPGTRCLSRAVSAFINMKKLHMISEDAMNRLSLCSNAEMRALAHPYAHNGTIRLTPTDLLSIYRYLL